MTNAFTRNSFPEMYEIKQRTRVIKFMHLKLLPSLCYLLRNPHTAYQSLIGWRIGFAIPATYSGHISAANTKIHISCVQVVKQPGLELTSILYQGKK
jgi:hypothetical protein